MGRDTDFIKGYPDEVLLEELRRVAILVNKPVLTAAEFAKHAGINARTVARRFGGWRGALEHAGLGHRHSGEAECINWHPHYRYTDGELLAELRRIAQLIDRPVFLRKDFSKHSAIHISTLCHRLGGWRNALEQAGLGSMYGHLYFGETVGRDSVHWRYYPDEALLEEVRRVAGLVGKPVFTQADFRRHSSINVTTLTRRFGNWQAVLKHAGVGRAFPRDCSDDVVFEEIRRVARILDKPVLGVKEFTRHSPEAAAVLLMRFGKWQDILKLAGLSHLFARATVDGHAPFAHRDGYPEETLLAEIRHVAELVNKPVLSTKDFKEHSKVGVNTISRRFGDWRSALERAGLGHLCAAREVAGRKLMSKDKIPDELMLDELRRVAMLVGRQVLTIKDFGMHSSIHPFSIARRFGGWPVALERAGLREMYARGADAVALGLRIRYPDETLLEELRHVAWLLGKPTLTTQDFRKHSTIGVTTVRRRFGHWGAALKRAGLTPSRKERP